MRITKLQALSTVSSYKKKGFNIKECEVMKENALVDTDSLLSYSSIKLQSKGSFGL